MADTQVVQTQISYSPAGGKMDYSDPQVLMNQGFQLFQRSKSARYMVENRWRRSNDQYDSIHPRESRKMSDVLLGQARLFISKTYNTVQRILTDLMDTFFFDPEEIVGVVGGKDVPSANVDAVKVLLNKRLSGSPINAYQEWLEACQDALKNKVGILKVFPRLKTAQKERKSKKYNDDGSFTEMVDHETVVTAFEPMMDCIAPEDLFLDPAATWKDYYKFPMVHRYVRSREHFRRRGFKNVDMAPGIRDLALGDQTKMQRQRTGLQSPFYQTLGPSDSDMICAFEVWDCMDMGKGYKSHVYTMLGMPEMPTHIGLEPVENTLPYGFSEFEEVRPPFVVGTAFPEAHKQYGKDLPEFTEGLQTETNIVRNQDREAAALAIRKPVLVNKDAGIDITGLVNRKIGSVVTGEDVSPDMVRELSLSSPIINTAAISSRIDQDYWEATSITPTQLGLSTKDETATGVTRTDANANKKIESIVRNMGWTLFVPAMKLLLRLEQAYETDEYIQAVTGAKLGWGKPNDGTPSWPVIQGEFDLTVELGMNKQMQLNRYFLLMDRANQANASLGQLVQTGVADPAQVKFINPMWAVEKIAGILHQKNMKEMQLDAKAPPPPAAGPGQKGVASQPGQNQNPSAAVSNMNPEADIAQLLG